jgi:hypothetical protein
MTKIEIKQKETGVTHHSNVVRRANVSQQRRVHAKCTNPHDAAGSAIAAVHRGDEQVGERCNSVTIPAAAALAAHRRSWNGTALLPFCMRGNPGSKILLAG